MSKGQKRKSLIIVLCIMAVLLVGIFLTGTGSEKHETNKETMRDAVLHETSKISFLGIIKVNPAFLSAVTLTVILLLFAACIKAHFCESPNCARIPYKPHR